MATPPSNPLHERNHSTKNRMSEIGEVSWNPQLEDYLRDTGEKSHCLSWCHKRSEEIYSYRRTFIDLPVIVGSGIIAFLNAGSSSMFQDPMISSVALGIGSFIVGALNTIGAYYGWSKRAEGHRISSIQYSRLYRFLRIEMGLPREERMTPKDLLKYVRDSYDRLQEISPLLPPEVVKEFHRKFDGYKTIAKPEEVNGLEAIAIYPLEPPSSPDKRSLTLSAPPSAESLGNLVATPLGMINNPMLKGKGIVSHKNPLQQSEGGETSLGFSVEAISASIPSETTNT